MNEDYSPIFEQTDAHLRRQPVGQHISINATDDLTFPRDAESLKSNPNRMNFGGILWDSLATSVPLVLGSSPILTYLTKPAGCASVSRLERASAKALPAIAPTFSRAYVWSLFHSFGAQLVIGQQLKTLANQVLDSSYLLKENALMGRETESMRESGNVKSRTQSFAFVLAS